MYNYEYDPDTGGILLKNSISALSKEPRPVYYKELDLFGFDKYWIYPHDDSAPILWAESSRYYYRGIQIANLRGGSIYSPPELIVTAEGSELKQLELVNVAEMVKKNQSQIESLANDSIKHVYATYLNFKDKVDLFYVAFSGGKDSIVALDIVRRALPHSVFKVLFGNTKMESPDTYDVVDAVSKECFDDGIEFHSCSSDLDPDESWRCFGPPSYTIRWCCTVHKTVPQITYLREITGKNDFVGMAFTGVRGAESVARSEYDYVSFGEKHKGQYSCHTILNWNSAELFLYIYSRNLILSEAYKKGNSRVGCLVCPMSPPKHDYVKQSCYPEEMDKFTDLITNTTYLHGKDEKTICDALNGGYWKSRKSGVNLNFGTDLFQTIQQKNKTIFEIIGSEIDDWKIWMSTIGDLVSLENDNYSLYRKDKIYHFSVRKSGSKIIISVDRSSNSKDEIEFVSLVRSVVIKSIYCVQCGACAVNCPHGQISMSKGRLEIGNDCIHCLKCHDIPSRCVRYNSIKNLVNGGKKLIGLDRYGTFGFKKSWLSEYFKNLDNFWDLTDLGTKMKDSFGKFLEDAELSNPVRIKSGEDKWSKYVPNELSKKLSVHGSDSELTWGIIAVNLSNTPQIQWYLENINPGERYSQERLQMMLESEVKGNSNKNITSSFKNIMVFTPLGSSLGLGNCDYVEKGGRVYLNFIERGTWYSPEPLVILYGLYRYAEKENVKQFRLSDLYSEGSALNPASIFNIDIDEMKNIINGLSIEYADYLSASFTLDLEVINLNDKCTSEMVLDLV